MLSFPLGCLMLLGLMLFPIVVSLNLPCLLTKSLWIYPPLTLHLALNVQPKSKQKSSKKTQPQVSDNNTSNMFDVLSGLNADGDTGMAIHDCMPESVFVECDVAVNNRVQTPNVEATT